ncbi:refilin-A-like isoform X2 [Amphiura filiformis]|uniref:refilin-A-like isoform X2 n=1 Tax=Amphiura filiformis TaxID=82378 RepID=UPI003B20D0FD
MVKIAVQRRIVVLCTEFTESERNNNISKPGDIPSSGSYTQYWTGDCQHNNCNANMAPRPVEYSESIALTHIPSYEQVSYGCECVYKEERHYRDEVRFQPGIAPTDTRYSSTEICYNNSSYRRYRDEVFHVPDAPSNKQYSTTVFLFPKIAQETVLSSITHYPAKTVKWYKAAVHMEARDQVSVKLIHVN